MCWLRTTAIVIATLLVTHARAPADPARFEPPSSIAAAQASYLRGKKLFEAKQFAAAADEFAAAYQLDPQAKFLLFNVGLARRMAGDCKEAIEAYRQFVDAGPPKKLAGNAQYGIGWCEKIVATEPAKPEPTPPPELAPERTPSEPSVIAPVATAPPLSDASEPWYRDRTGNLLVITGGVLVGTSTGALYLLARRRADATEAPSSLQDFEDNRVAASRLQIASVITGVAGGILVVAGAIHYAAHRPAPRRVAAVPVDGGAMVVVGGRF